MSKTKPQPSDAIIRAACKVAKPIGARPTVLPAKYTPKKGRSEIAKRWEKGAKTAAQ